MKVTNEEADLYYNTRHEESKIGAWASKQSSELANRQVLEKNINYYKKKFNNKKIKRPDHWTGYRVVPNLIEFWQDMPFRLHDRLEFVRVDNKWIVKKLYP